MNMKKKKILLLFFVIILAVLVIIAISLGNNNNEQNKVGETIIDSVNKYEYSFGETVNLEDQVGGEENASNGTDYPGFGVLSDFYDDANVRYEGDKLYIQSYDGQDIVSLSWLNDGFAKYVPEPDFGYIKKCVVKNTQFAAVYTNVEMDDVEDYIEKLSELGFSNVTRDEKNKRKGYYLYNVKRDNITVIIKYTNNNDLEITVF